MGPGGSSIASWLAEDFGVGSEHGHTVIFPHQTDACATCSSLKVDIQSVEASLKRHTQQTGDMTMERQEAMAELKRQLVELKHERDSHKAESGEAQESYKKRVLVARDAYLELQLARTRYVKARMQRSHDDCSEEFEKLIMLAKIFVFSMDSDYQQATTTTTTTTTVISCSSW